MEITDDLQGTEQGGMPSDVETNSERQATNEASFVLSDDIAQTVTTAARLTFEQQQVAQVQTSINDHEQEAYLRAWKDNDFAVGYTKPKWSDEQMNCHKFCLACCNPSKPHLPYMYCTSFLCGCFHAGRVGNMVVLKQRLVEFDDDDVDVEDNVNVDEEVAPNRPRSRRPKLICLVGPYFAITMAVTIPFLSGLTAYTVYKGIWNRNLRWATILGWALVTFLMFYSLIKTSCSDPGILYRRRTMPQNQDEEWRWNDQALSYRPITSKFDSEVQAIVEEFDHTCPWVGTAIGKRNMPSFRRFLLFLAVVTAYDITLLVFVK